MYLINLMNFDETTTIWDVHLEEQIYVFQAYLMPKHSSGL